MAAFCMIGVIHVVTSTKTQAHYGRLCPDHSKGCCATCEGCHDTEAAKNTLRNDHANGETQILDFMREKFHMHREWIVNHFMVKLYVPALMMMTEQMSSVAMYQMQLVGEFYDAKLHLETQRLFNVLQNEAAKDYQPSDSFCYIGTNVRSLSHSEMLSKFDQGALNKAFMNRQLGNMNANSAYTAVDQDKKGRWDQFVTTYCDPKDNNWSSGMTGLVSACGTGASDKDRINRDINYQRLVEEPRHLEIDLNNKQVSADEEDVMALSRNLYGHLVPPANIPFLAQDASQHKYMALRSAIAKRSVAQNSFNAIVSMKASGSGGGDSAQYFKAIVKDLGLSEPEIDEIFGENPSYYAQLEALGKKMYENADFFTDLFDKPANVKRKQAALNAIELMLDRAIYESEIRHEMILSVLLATRLEQDKEKDFSSYERAEVE